MRIGLVCPYSLDVPGGVQFHVRDLAQHLIGQGHHVSVLAPADGEVPDYVEPAGRAVPVPFNGSVSRLTFGPVTAARVRRWLAGGDFDVLHIHEPLSPSTSLLALWAATGPVVATFHSANLRSRVMQTAFPLLRPSLEKISARIAVSEDARRTVVEHFGGDAVVVPNGVFVDRFARAEPDPRWQGRPGAPTVAFVGRLDEPRKGLALLLRMVPPMRTALPRVRFFVAGRGDAAAAEAVGGDHEAVTFLGEVDEDSKARLLASVDAYLAPNSGGESFGVVLVEAMSAGAAVVASDLGAFRRVLGDGRFGVLFPVNDTAQAVHQLASLLRDDPRRHALSEAARRAARRYDWTTVAAEVLAVYETVVLGSERVAEDPTTRTTRWGRS